jgi:hypothetical protein
VKDWLAKEGGGGLGGVSKAVRRLVKEEQWRREGKYIDLPKDEYEDLVGQRKRFLGKLVMAGKATQKELGPRPPKVTVPLGSAERPICGVRTGPGARCVQDKGHEGRCG